MKAFITLAALLAVTQPAMAQSFNCRHADTRTEEAICDNPQLRALDRRMSWAYARALRSGDTSTREQRRWLASRDACGGSDGCIRAAYVQRLRELRQ